jgi:hypothetical protein
MKMPQRRLCQKDKKLCESHIVPRFLYDELLNSKHQLMGINGCGKRGWKPTQDGAKEELLCSDCERHINDNFEKPFRKLWIDNFPLLDPWTADDIHWITVNYKSFKLFHLSVLFRASVSSLPIFAAVKLGPREERLRRLLMNNDPGEFWQYPIFGHAVIEHQTKELVRVVTGAQAYRFGGSQCYALIYGGVQWAFLRLIRKKS